MLVEKQQRAKRVDAGVVRQTARDAALLEWIAHMYGLPMDLLQRYLGISQVRTYQLVQRWKRAGWVKTAKVDAGPTWVYLTRSTATRYLGWDADWTPRATNTGHARAVAALRLYRSDFELERWISERTLRHEQGYRKKGTKEEYTPDGIEVLPDGRRVLIEVELTAKGPDRMRGVVSDVMHRANHLGCFAVAYWATPSAASSVEAAVAAYRQEWGVRDVDPQWFIERIGDVPGWTVEGPTR